MHKYWIDIQTGTWGHCDDLRIVDLDKLADDHKHSEPPPTPQDYVTYWQQYASDSEIAEFGDKHGRRVAP
jgi:hypothetical protein